MNLSKNSKLLTFDDVLIVPKFNTIESRKDVNLSTWVGLNLNLPIISANMDTVTGSEMAKAMRSCGAVGALHRFDIRDKRIYEYRSVYLGLDDAFVSIGVSDVEYGIAEDLYKAGARLFIIDVAHGASKQVADQMVRLKNKYPDTFVMVGNFATGDSYKEFVKYAGMHPDAVKVGIGPGSMCTTRIKTGCGFPQLSAIKSISYELGNTTKLVADGGMRTPGDIAKALAAGADAVMLGGMLAGTDETPGDLVYAKYHEMVDYSNAGTAKVVGHIGLGTGKKVYRGSASAESYKDQGKDESWRAAEGDSTLIDPKGPVRAILRDIEGSLRSALTYVGARNLMEFRENAEFVEISGNTLTENGSHGK
jgi:IMP dehydrogenase